MRKSKLEEEEVKSKSKKSDSKKNDSKKKVSKKYEKLNSKIKWSILYFYGSYGLFYAIALIYHYIFTTQSFTFNFYITEKAQAVQFTVLYAELMDIILLGILFSINTFRTYMLLQDRTEHDNRLQGRFSYLTGVIILNFGVITHMVANQLHEFIYSMEAVDPNIITSNPNLNQLALGLYFWDEVVSHLFTGVGFFILIVVYLYIEARNDSIVTKLENKKILLISFLVGTGVAFGLIEGQAAAAFFFISLILIPYTFFRRNKKPFHYSTLMVCLGFVLFTVIYVLITGLKDYYPFIRQLTEL